MPNVLAAKSQPNSDIFYQLFYDATLVTHILVEIDPFRELNAKLHAKEEESPNGQMPALWTYGKVGSVSITNDALKVLDITQQEVSHEKKILQVSNAHYVKKTIQQIVKSVLSTKNFKTPIEQMETMWNLLTTVITKQIIIILCLKIALWDADGAAQHIQEMKCFITCNDIDIILL
ncbi:hypothetical protein JTB14_017354 [Gonioctena quinquepunctata]|nr:hypothetical protein JTB14_017354 [Gonioctena quinquepunctata]